MWLLTTTWFVKFVSRNLWPQTLLHTPSLPLLIAWSRWLSTEFASTFRFRLRRWRPWRENNIMPNETRNDMKDSKRQHSPSFYPATTSDACNTTISPTLWLFNFTKYLTTLHPPPRARFFRFAGHAVTVAEWSGRRVVPRPRPRPRGKFVCVCYYNSNWWATRTA